MIPLSTGAGTENGMRAPSHGTKKHSTKVPCFNFIGRARESTSDLICLDGLDEGCEYSYRAMYETEIRTLVGVFRETELELHSSFRIELGGGARALDEGARAWDEGRGRAVNVGVLVTR